MSKSIEIMADEIAAQAKLFELCGDDIMKQVGTILEKTEMASKANRIYITGCGDSYCAGLACRDFFAKYAKVQVEVHHAMEFSKYICPTEVDEQAIVLSISSSGRVARTIECALRAKEMKAFSIGITSNPDGPLAKTAMENIFVNIPNVVGVAPGTQSYIASQLALMCFAIALGKEKGVLSDEDVREIFAYITELGEAMKLTVKNNFELIRKYLAAYSSEENPNKIKIFHILGSGPNWGTALFGSMKLLEASGFDSIPQGVEEWAHTQYFTTKPGTHTVVLAPKGGSRNRALEILQAVTVMDGKKIVIGEENDEELARAADIYLPICGMDGIKEEFSQLIYPIPLELMAMHLSEVLGIKPFEFDQKPWRRAENFRQIFDSRIEPLK
jgi:glucosamine 6-phosphate synthetase-like amidotransferase/phosphosugar isomerase protein